jgi:hypothetical protein
MKVGGRRVESTAGAVAVGQAHAAWVGPAVARPFGCECLNLLTVLRFPPPLIESDVRISRIRLTLCFTRRHARSDTFPTTPDAEDPDDGAIDLDQAESAPPARELVSLSLGLLVEPFPESLDSIRGFSPRSPDRAAPAATGVYRQLPGRDSHPLVLETMDARLLRSSAHLTNLLRVALPGT